MDSEWIRGPSSRLTGVCLEIEELGRAPGCTYMQILASRCLPP